jgi:hypothetical protein
MLVDQNLTLFSIRTKTPYCSTLVHEYLVFLSIDLNVVEFICFGLLVGIDSRMSQIRWILNGSFLGLLLRRTLDSLHLAYHTPGRERTTGSGRNRH